MILNLLSRLGFSEVNIANPSSIVEIVEVNPELAELFTDEEHIDEFEAVVNE